MQCDTGAAAQGAAACGKQRCMKCDTGLRERVSARHSRLRQAAKRWSVEGPSRVAGTEDRDEVRYRTVMEVIPSVGGSYHVA